MNPCSESKPNGVKLENPKSPATKLATGIQQFYPAIFFGICFLAMWVWRATTAPSPSFDLIVISTALIASLLVVNQRLPLQNIVGLIVTIVIFWWATLLIAKISGVFFYPPLFRFHFFREYEFGLFWAVGLINGRGIAKLILRRWKKSANCGLWLIALSSLLVTIEDSDARKKVIYFAEKFVFVAGAFIATTPWFIDKKGIDQKLDYQPLIITILLMLW